jgi:CubicO group peptidase (beta-lactamase class C family)
MVLLKEIVEHASEEPFAWFLKETFYDPMGLLNISFNPFCCFDKCQLVPTQFDKLFRQQLVHGYVHDPCAALLGGYSGHAGLFASAYDLAAIGQMLLNQGTYNKKQFLKPETIALFTKKHSTISRRALGWDKPEMGAGISPASKLASAKTFGHTGFTGTCIWIDPEHDLVYVFLSNRIFPNEENRELITGNYRTKIQDIIYQNLSPKP